MTPLWHHIGNVDGLLVIGPSSVAEWFSGSFFCNFIFKEQHIYGLIQITRKRLDIYVKIMWCCGCTNSSPSRLVESFAACHHPLPTLDFLSISVDVTIIHSYVCCTALLHYYVKLLFLKGHACSQYAKTRQDKTDHWTAILLLETMGTTRKPTFWDRSVLVRYYELFRIWWCLKRPSARVKWKLWSSFKRLIKHP